MDKLIALKQALNVAGVLRQAGYHPLNEAWVRPLSRSHYPRFHLYLSEQPTQIKLSLHLDQKQSTMNIPGLKRHAGDYNSSVVSEECGRIERWILYAQSARLPQ